MTKIIEHLEKNHGKPRRLKYKPLKIIEVSPTKNERYLKVRFEQEIEIEYLTSDNDFSKFLASDLLHNHFEIEKEKRLYVETHTNTQIFENKVYKNKSGETFKLEVGQIYPIPIALVRCRSSVPMYEGHSPKIIKDGEKAYYCTMFLTEDKVRDTMDITAFFTQKLITNVTSTSAEQWESEFSEIQKDIELVYEKVAVS